MMTIGFLSIVLLVTRLCLVTQIREALPRLPNMMAIGFLSIVRVLVTGILSKQGLSPKDWVNDFNSPSNEFDVEVIEEF